MMRQTGLAPWEFPFPGSLTSTFLTCRDVILDGLEQRRQINAKLNEYAYAAANIDRDRLEAEYNPKPGTRVSDDTRLKPGTKNSRVLSPELER